MPASHSLVGGPCPHLTDGYTEISGHSLAKAEPICSTPRLPTTQGGRKGRGARNMLGPFHPQVFWSLTLLEEICMLVTGAESSNTCSSSRSSPSALGRPPLGTEITFSTVPASVPMKRTS